MPCKSVTISGPAEDGDGGGGGGDGGDGTDSEKTTIFGLTPTQIGIGAIGLGIVVGGGLRSKNEGRRR